MPENNKNPLESTLVTGPEKLDKSRLRLKQFYFEEVTCKKLKIMLGLFRNGKDVTCEKDILVQAIDMLFEVNKDKVLQL